MTAKPRRKPSQAPKGRNNIAQGKRGTSAALGKASAQVQSPEGARQSGDLPAGWKLRTIGELASSEPNAITDGPFGSKLKTEHYTRSGPRVVRLTNIGDGDFVDAHAHISDEHFASLKKHRIFAGDIVIAALGEKLPRACLIPDTVGPAIVKADCIRFKPSEEHSPKFLNYALNWEGTQKRTSSIVHGVGRPRLNLSEIKSIVLPIAPPVDQRRIVAEIEKQFTRLEVGVTALRRVQANLKRYRAAVLKAACEGDWPQRALGEIAEVRLGKMLDKTKHVSGRKLPYLRNVNVRWGKTDTDDLREMYFEENQLERFGLKAGDVLVCEGGEPGRAAVWSGHLPEMKYQKAIHRVRFNIPFDARLLVWLLERLALTGGLERRFTGSTIKHFTREAFIELPIPVPPLAEQTRIVAEVERRLSVVEELETVVAVNLQRATRLRQSILQKAFTGTLLAARGLPGNG